MQERCCLGRRIKLLLGLCLLAAICLWSAYRSGLFGRGPAAASSARSGSTQIAPITTISATASSAPVAAQSKAVADNAFPSSASALNDDDPSTFIALRYDKTHVLFRLGDSGDFSLDRPEDEKMLHSLREPIAEYGGAPTSEPDAKMWDSLREHFDQAHVGEQWQLEVSAGSRIPVVVQKPIELVWGC